MKYLVVFLALLGCAYAGTIEGTLSYPGGGFGAYIVLAIGPDVIASLMGSDSFDIVAVLESLPKAILFAPGAYSIEYDFMDGVPYTLFGMKVADVMNPMPASGDPMGMYPEPVYTFAGDASGIDIELDTIGAIGGHITYPGNIAHVKVEVTDRTTGAGVPDGIFLAGAYDYTITVPSGFKTLFFFADVNGNDTWDITGLEAGREYSGALPPEGWGPLVFAGGGDRFATGVDIELPASRVDEKLSCTKSLRLECSPNPFNSSGIVQYSAPGEAIIAICDIAGKVVMQSHISGKGHISIAGNLPAGTYLANMKAGNDIVSRKILIMR